MRLSKGNLSKELAQPPDVGIILVPPRRTSNPIRVISFPGLKHTQI
jgi:hypothetical protein